MTAEERSEAARKAVAGYWGKLSPEERSAEMKRRAAKRRKKGSSKEKKEREAGRDG